jgi:hypothetical protein
MAVADPPKANTAVRFCITKFVTEIELIQSKRLRKRFDA